MKKTILFLILVFFVHSNSCKKEDQFVSIFEPDFQKYVDRFTAEAALTIFAGGLHSRKFIVNVKPGYANPPAYKLSPREFL